jgi:hypothetical protein
MKALSVLHTINRGGARVQWPMFNRLWFAFCQLFEMWFNHSSLVNTPSIFNFAYNTPSNLPFATVEVNLLGIFLLFFFSFHCGGA